MMHNKHRDFCSSVFTVIEDLFRDKVFTFETFDFDFIENLEN